MESRKMVQMNLEEHGLADTVGEVRVGQAGRVN